MLHKVPVELRRRFRALCVLRGQSMTERVIELMRDDVASMAEVPRHANGGERKAG